MSAAGGIGPVVDHMPYLPNPASPDAEIYEKSVASLAGGELRRCALLGIPYLVTHLGHHRGAGTAAGGQERVVAALNRAFADAGGDAGVMLLLENTAGEKNSVGTTVDDLSRIMEGGIDAEGRVGICFDTCHAFAAGYDSGRPKGSMRSWMSSTTGSVYPISGSSTSTTAKGISGAGLTGTSTSGSGRSARRASGISSVTRPSAASPLICETPVDGQRDDTGNIAKVRELAGA